MTTTERKRRLKNRIDVSDEETLKKIEKMLEIDDVYRLSDEQILKVNEASLEYESGQSTIDEEEQKQMQLWFLEQEK